MKFKHGVTAVIRSLGGGGAERVLTTMLNFWVERGIPCTVITTTNVCDHAYSLNPAIRCITIAPIDYHSTMDDCPWNILELRQAIKAERNSLLLSFMEKSNIPCILASSGLPVTLIVSERTDPRTQLNHSEYKKALVKRLYPLADALVVQTYKVKEQWGDTFMPQHKTHVIHNMISVDDNISYEHLQLPQNFLCCMGHLSKTKGFLHLIEILPEIFKKYPLLHMVILGEGADRHLLAKRSQELNITEKLHMPGFLSCPHGILKQAQVFILPSMFEGFPNALIEAMFLAVPSISFDCPSGPSEIIEHGFNGVLIPNQDYQSLKEGILELLANEEKRKLLSVNAMQSSAYKYATTKIMEQWDCLWSSLELLRKR